MAYLFLQSLPSQAETASLDSLVRLLFDIVMLHEIIVVLVKRVMKQFVKHRSLLAVKVSAGEEIGSENDVGADTAARSRRVSLI